MSFSLEDVQFDGDFTQVIDCMFTSYRNPHQTLFDLFHPVLGTGTAALRAAVAKSATRLFEWYQRDAGSLWHKVVEKETGRIVGGAFWRICTCNPFQQGPVDRPVTWYPEGRQAEYVTLAIGMYNAPRARLVQKAHIYLSSIFTHPDYRLRGVADMMLRWGTRTADSRNLEIWLEAWPLSFRMYEKYGFGCAEDNIIRPHSETLDPDWKMLSSRLQPLATKVMYRVPGPQNPR